MKIEDIVNKQFELEGYDTSYKKLQSENWIVKDKKKDVIWWEYYTISLENSIIWDKFVKDNTPDKYLKTLFLYALTTRWNEKAPVK